jgi:hypothetical protein
MAGARRTSPPRIPASLRNRRPRSLRNVRPSQLGHRPAVDRYARPGGRASYHSLSHHASAIPHLVSGPLALFTMRQGGACCGSQVDSPPDRSTGLHPSGGMPLWRPATRQSEYALLALARRADRRHHPVRDAAREVRRARSPGSPRLPSSQLLGPCAASCPTLPGTRDTCESLRRAADGGKRVAGQGWTIPVSPNGPSLTTIR